MTKLVLSSPAKLNLYLKVFSKRPDGYHDIKTVFERIDLCDEIAFCPDKTGQVRIYCDNPQVPTGPKNLVHKVASLLQREEKTGLGVQIWIKKRIPVAAGLAGGSSNAATTLLGLNKVWKLGLGRPDLVRYARKIGSDVAFFLSDCSWALGTEKGDHIKELAIKTKLWQILVTPRLSLYSWKVYGALKMQLTKKNDNANILIRNLKQGNILEVGQLLENDLESAVMRLCPKLLQLKEKLKSFETKGVMVSGSGPSVFGIVDSEDHARRALRELSKHYKQVFAVRTL